MQLVYLLQIYKFYTTKTLLSSFQRMYSTSSQVHCNLLLNPSTLFVVFSVMCHSLGGQLCSLQLLNMSPVWQRSWTFWLGNTTYTRQHKTHHCECSCQLPLEKENLWYHPQKGSGDFHDCIALEGSARFDPTLRLTGFEMNRQKNASWRCKLILTLP